MAYELSKNDRFFLNQLIPKWETGKPFDLLTDLKYIFHREKGSSYNEAQFEYTVKTLKAFLEEHKFARETRQYIFELLPKANMLMVKGTIESFEDYQERERATGHSAPARPSDSSNSHIDAIRRRNEAFKLAEQENAPRRTGYAILLLLALCAIVTICVITWRYING